jgi:hypothetical protein
MISIAVNRLSGGLVCLPLPAKRWALPHQVRHAAAQSFINDPLAM